MARTIRPGDVWHGEAVQVRTLTDELGGGRIRITVRSNDIGWFIIEQSVAPAAGDYVKIEFQQP
jgi:hypothetical protein